MINWTRVEIKEEAKVFLRKHYWKAFVVCLIIMLLGITTTGIGSQTVEFKNIDNNVMSNGNYNFNSSILKVSVFILLFIFFVMVILFSTIGPLLNVGKARFFVNGIREDSNVQINTIISTFQWGEAWPVIKTYILKNLSIIFWTILFIIPGIIKSYEYFFVDYIMAENPNMDSKDVLNFSKEITQGHKLDIWILRLSFLGWDILGALLCGVGRVFINPYKEATYAVLYNKLSKDSLYY